VEEETYSALGVSEQGIVLRSSLGAVRFHAFSEMMSWTFGAHNSSLTYLIPGRLHSREVVVDGLQISSVLAMIRQYQGFHFKISIVFCFILLYDYILHNYNAVI
jgi:hypothetical protein